MPATIDTAITYSPLGRYFSRNYGAELTITGCEYAAHVTAEMIAAGEVDCRLGADVTVIYASADGRMFNETGWHHGPSSEGVYVERLGGKRDFHGWVDAQSRRLVQAG